VDGQSSEDSYNFTLPKEWKPDVKMDEPPAISDKESPDEEPPERVPVRVEKMMRIQNRRLDQKAVMQAEVSPSRISPQACLLTPVPPCPDA
jgi:hypothetical protein